jgi:hypothetical protein
MSARFGDVEAGTAGETLIVAAEQRIRAADLEGTVVIETGKGSVELPGGRVAAPCREFTSYLLGLSDVAPREEIEADLDFLEDGMRGFVFGVDHLRGWTTVRPGDVVWVRG